MLLASNPIAGCTIPIQVHLQARIESNQCLYSVNRAQSNLHRYLNRMLCGFLGRRLRSFLQNQYSSPALRPCKCEVPTSAE